MKTRKITFTTILALAVFLFLLASPFFMSVFRLSLLAKFMCFAIVALGLDMIWGYTGILSLGHGVYFGLGAYCMAMYLKLSTAGVGKLPDFMVWSGMKELPSFWIPFANPVFAMAAVIIVPILLAVVIGYLTFLNHPVPGAGYDLRCPFDRTAEGNRRFQRSHRFYHVIRTEFK